MGKGHYSLLRVSHLSQIDNFSIEQQKESIETYARFHSIEITEHLAECGSGTTDERKQIQTLYRLIEEDKVEGILCYKLDRIFRNMKLSIDFISTCVEKGIKIHSVASTSPTSEYRCDRSKYGLRCLRQKRLREHGRPLQLGCRS